MLDDVVCAQLRYESEPVVAAPALIALRELLDAQALLASGAETRSEGALPTREVTMRRSTVQHTLPFEHREIWESLPLEQCQQCRALCRQLLRAVMEHDDRVSGEEESHEREDSHRTS